MKRKEKDVLLAIQDVGSDSQCEVLQVNWSLVGGIDDVQGEAADKECAQRKTAVSEITTNSPAAVARPATAAEVGSPRGGNKDEEVVLDDEARCSDRVNSKKING